MNSPKLNKEKMIATTIDIICHVFFKEKSALLMPSSQSGGSYPKIVIFTMNLI